mmetsp:Transcript_51374/g.144766  ORF Transcript_51374/g.144766 Transcript_51374/m.144766 type:complete len:572 (-) Transcript_51374:205-1920(-)
MDVVTDVATAASSVVRQSTSALQVAAGELAKQANSVAQMAGNQDAIAWLVGDEDSADEPLDDVRPPGIVPVPLAALQPWGAGWAGATPGGLYGARPAFVPADDGGRGSGQDGAEPPTAIQRRAPPFAVDPELNSKIVLWTGDACALEVEALLTPTATGYTVGTSTIYQKVLRYGGKDLRQDLKYLDACRSGEARTTKAYGLPCRMLLLTVGPKYKDKYYIAAQNTLNACYRECFHQLAEAELRTLAIPCMWYTKGYPAEEQAHVAFRTIRRCLEQYRGQIDTVVLVAASVQEFEMFDSLMSLYFPRTRREAETGIEVLPDSCWNAWGEVAVQERRIRVSSHLISTGDDSDDDNQGRGQPLFSAEDDNDRAFLNARDDADSVAIQRLEGTMIEAETPEAARAACMRYLRFARDARQEPAQSRFVFTRSGGDCFGHNVVVLLGARFPALGVRDERTIPLFVKELELLRDARFVILYVNSAVSALDTTRFEVLQEMLAVISAKYRNSLIHLLVLHPGLWFRAAFALGWALSDSAASVWHDTIYLQGLVDLEQYFNTEGLQLPEYVRHYDKEGYS